MKYYIQVLSKWYAFVCIFISCPKFFMIDKKGLRVECYGGKERQEVKVLKKKCTEELRTFGTMSNSDSEQESLDSSSSKEGLGKSFIRNNNHSRKQINQNTESFF